MRILISTETTVDLSKEIIEANNIKIIPFTVLLGEEVGLDGEITPEMIFDFVDKTGTLPRTSAINEYAYTEHFEKLLKEGDAVIHFSLSSELSSSYRNALHASQDFKNVYVIDSKSLSTGIALQVLYAVKLVKEGKTPEEIVNLVEERKSHVQASFVVNTLSYLHKGGRCSGSSRFLGAILRIKPQILVTPEGKMEPGKKFIGRGVPVVTSYCEETLKAFPNPDKTMVFITHSHATPEMIEAARKVLEEHGFRNILVTVAGATITAHCGPKTLGILYYNDGDLM